jgi:hypothetical protein
MRPHPRSIAALAFVAVLAAAFVAPADPAGAAGNSIEQPDPLVSTGIDSSLALNGAGNPVVSYRVGPPAIIHSELRLLFCGDADCSAGNSFGGTFTAAVDDGAFSSLELDGSTPVVSFFDDTNDDLNVYRQGSGVATPDSAGLVGQTTSLELDGSIPVVSYYDRSNGNLKVLRCGDAACSMGNTITSPDTAGDVGAGTSLALDADDDPVIAYRDATNNDLKVLHCGDETCSTGTPVSLDTAATVGFGGVGTEALELDASGNPVVAYYDSALGDLKLIHCGNEDCTDGNTITTVDSDTDAGQYAALELDSSGRPVIAYYDATYGDLRVVRCGNEDCTAGNLFALPHVSNDAGRDVSLALDTSDNPVVSYTESTGFLQDRVHVLHCGDPTCKGGPIGGITELAKPFDGAGGTSMAWLAALGAAFAVAAGAAVWLGRRVRSG